MARTQGSKNKPKVIRITKTEADVANKLGVTTEQFAKEKIKLSRKPRKPRTPKIDWEKLAKDLQQALAKEMKENQQIESHNIALTKQTIRLEGIIQYLESKLGNN